MNLQWFPPLKSSPSAHEFIAFDTEDDQRGWGTGRGFYLGAVRTPAGSHTFVRKHHLRRFLASPRWRGYWCATYNLEYDLLNLFGPREVLRMDPAWSGSKLCGARLQIGPTDRPKDCLNFFDVSCFLPGGLAKLAPLVGLEKLEMKHSRGDRRVDARRREYCARDTEITWKLAAFLQEGFLKLGAQMRLTAAGTALDLFRRRFLHERLPILSDEMRDSLYAGYYGGRVECFRLGEYRGPIYGNDFKGMYSSCMADLELPCLAGLADGHSLDLSREGMAEVDVSVPDHLWAGPMPTKTEIDNEQKLCFPVGHLRGWWTYNELRNALNAGCKLERVRRTVQSARSEPYLREYALTLNKVRETTKEAEVSAVAKLCSNSLYGKLAARNAEWELMSIGDFVRAQDDGTLGEYDETRTYELPLFGAVRICRKTSYPPYCNVVWAAAITAAARAKLYAHLDEETTLYCDTDSVIGYKQYGQSNRIGSLVCKDVYSEMKIVGNKMYAGKIAAGKDAGSWEAHAKGYPRDIALAAVMHPEQAHSWRRPVKWRSALRGQGHANEWIEVSRRSVAVYDKRAVLGEGQATVPLRMRMW